MNIGDFGNLASLTSLSKVQSSVLDISPRDLLKTESVLEGNGALPAAPPGALLGNMIPFAEEVEYLQPMVENIEPVASYIILQQLGLTTPPSGIGSAPGSGVVLGGGVGAASGMSAGAGAVPAAGALPGSGGVSESAAAPAGGLVPGSGTSSGSGIL